MNSQKMVKQDQPSSKPVSQTEELPLVLPEVDILENETEFRLIADMPGVDEKHVDIDVDKNVLTIRGRFVPQPPAGFTLNYQEYSSGHYERSFTLGNTIDRDAIKATVSNGTLRLTLPKAKEAHPRRIPVTAGK